MCPRRLQPTRDDRIVRAQWLTSVTFGVVAAYNNFANRKFSAPDENQSTESTDGNDVL